MEHLNADNSALGATEQPKRKAKQYRPGDELEVTVDGDDEPFRFAVKLLAFQKLTRASQKKMGVAISNFIRECSLDWDRLEPLVNEDSDDFDMTLELNLGEGLMDAIGLAREVTVKKL